MQHSPKARDSKGNTAKWCYPRTKGLKHCFHNSLFILREMKLISLSTWEAEERGCLSSRPASLPSRVAAQPRLHIKSLSQDGVGDPQVTESLTALLRVPNPQECGLQSSKLSHISHKCASVVNHKGREDRAGSQQGKTRGAHTSRLKTKEKRSQDSMSLKHNSELP